MYSPGKVPVEVESESESESESEFESGPEEEWEAEAEAEAEPESADSNSNSDSDSDPEVALGTAPSDREEQTIVPGLGMLSVPMLSTDQCFPPSAVISALIADCGRFPSTCRAVEDAVTAVVAMAIRTSVLLPHTVISAAFASMVKWKVTAALFQDCPGELQPVWALEEGPGAGFALRRAPRPRKHRVLKAPFVWVYCGTQVFIGHEPTLNDVDAQHTLAGLAARATLDTGVPHEVPTSWVAFLGSPCWTFSLGLLAAGALQLSLAFNAFGLHASRGLAASREFRADHAHLRTLEEEALRVSADTGPLAAGLSRAAALSLRRRIIRNCSPGTKAFKSRENRLRAQEEAEAAAMKHLRRTLVKLKVFMGGRAAGDTHPDALFTGPCYEPRKDWVPPEGPRAPKVHFRPGSGFPTSILSSLQRFSEARGAVERTSNILKLYMHRVQDLLLNAIRRTTQLPCHIAVNNIIYTLHTQLEEGQTWPLPGAFYLAVITAVQRIVSGEVPLPPDLAITLADVSARDTTRASTTTNTLQAISLLTRSFTLRLGLPNPKQLGAPLAVHGSFSGAAPSVPDAARFMACVLHAAGFLSATVSLPRQDRNCTGQASVRLPFRVAVSAPVFTSGKNPGVLRALQVMANYSPGDRGTCFGLPPWLGKWRLARSMNSGFRMQACIGARKISVAVFDTSMVLTGYADHQDFVVAGIAVCLQLFLFSATPWAILPLDGCPATLSTELIHGLLTRPRTDLPAFNMGNACLDGDPCTPDALCITPNGPDSVVACIANAVRTSNFADRLRME